MRSDAMKALKLRAPGANPAIHLSLVGHPISDPQFFALQSTFRDAKFLARPQVMAPLLTAAVHETRKVPGPCTLLLQRANEVGIAWDPVLPFLMRMGPWMCGLCPGLRSLETGLHLAGLGPATFCSEAYL